jgi:hypothetical protein
MWVYYIAIFKYEQHEITGEQGNTEAYHMVPNNLDGPHESKTAHRM